jgi:hypothetical protein
MIDAASRRIPPQSIYMKFQRIANYRTSHSPDSPAPAFKLKQCNMIRKLEARLGIAISNSVHWA